MSCFSPAVSEDPNSPDDSDIMMHAADALDGDVYDAWYEESPASNNDYNSIDYIANNVSPIYTEEDKMEISKIMESIIEPTESAMIPNDSDLIESSQIDKYYAESDFDSIFTLSV